MTDAVTTSAALRTWLADRFGGPVDEAEAPSSSSDGFDAAIHFVRFRGPALPDKWAQPLVARVSRGADRLALSQREAWVQDWCAAHGFPAPRVLAVIAPGDALAVPVQVMERAPGVTLQTAMTRAPWRVPALVDEFGRLHARLHRLPADEWPDDGRTLLDGRLAKLRSMVAGGDHPDLARALERIDPLLPALGGVDPLVCHGDYHPLNVVADGRRLSVLDWTDAGLGDRQGDVARTALLFEIATDFVTGATRVVAGRFSPWLRRRYLAAYSRELPVDELRLRLWAPVHLLQLWGQADELDRPTEARRSLAARFENALLAAGNQ